MLALLVLVAATRSGEAGSSPLTPCITPLECAAGCECRRQSNYQSCFRTPVSAEHEILCPPVEKEESLPYLAQKVEAHAGDSCKSALDCTDDVACLCRDQVCDCPPPSGPTDAPDFGPCTKKCDIEKGLECKWVRLVIGGLKLHGRVESCEPSDHPTEAPPTEKPDFGPCDLECKQGFHCKWEPMIEGYGRQCVKDEAETEESLTTTATTTPCELVWEIGQHSTYVQQELLKSAASQKGFTLKQEAHSMKGTYTSPTGVVQKITIQNIPFHYNEGTFSTNDITGASNKEGRAALQLLMPASLKAYLNHDNCVVKEAPVEATEEVAASAGRCQPDGEPLCSGDSEARCKAESDMCVWVPGTTLLVV